MKDYLSAPFSPLGRLSLAAYWALSAPPTLMIIGIRWYVKTTDEPSTALSATVLLLMWMQFCLLCRRLQDSGIPGLVLLPFVGFSTFLLLFDLDPYLLGENVEAVKLAWSTIFKIAIISTLFTACGWLFALFSVGDPDENDFGPPFRETVDSLRQKRTDKIRDRVRTEFGAPGEVEPANARIATSLAAQKSTVPFDPDAADAWDPRFAPAGPRGLKATKPQKTSFGRH
jgi:uncharacterized membrane protein YhaH (DUF805 family)